MKAKTYLITGIDAGTWKDFKTACAHYDLSIRATLIKHIENIVNDFRRDRMIHNKPKVEQRRWKKK